MKWSFFLMVFLISFGQIPAQNVQVQIDTVEVTNSDPIELSETDYWWFRKGNDSSWSTSVIDTSKWEKRSPIDLDLDLENDHRDVEGWFRAHITLKKPLLSKDYYLNIDNFGQAVEVFVNGHKIGEAGKISPYERTKRGATYVFGPLMKDTTNTIAIHYLHKSLPFYSNWLMKDVNLYFDVSIVSNLPSKEEATNTYFELSLNVFSVTVNFTVFLLFLFFFLSGKRNLLTKVITLCTFLFFNIALTDLLTSEWFYSSSSSYMLLDWYSTLSFTTLFSIIPFVFSLIFSKRIPKYYWLIFPYFILTYIEFNYMRYEPLGFTVLSLSISACAYYPIKYWKSLKGAQWAIIVGSILFLSFPATFFLFMFLGLPVTFLMTFFPLFIIVFPGSVATYFVLRMNEVEKEVVENAEKLVRVTEEKRLQTVQQNNQLEVRVRERTAELNQSLRDLKATQDQLVQQEKLASLGQLTAGIAHEIKNPLNFVNNFSDLSIELIDEAFEELQVLGEHEKAQEAIAILKDVKSNLAKIHEHGTRADSIVKSMLQHSRGGDGSKELTDLNALLKEFVNLSFHGMRAGKNPINVDLVYDFDESVGEVPLLAEDFSRAIVNICNNAFDACAEKIGTSTSLSATTSTSLSATTSTSLSATTSTGHKDETSLSIKAEPYLPKLTVRTRRIGDAVRIEIEDNGPGIPEEIKDKILQPFFTTKKGTQGTGLGLSITNDIVKAHGGELKIENLKENGTVFIIQLPYQQAS